MRAAAAVDFRTSHQIGGKQQTERERGRRIGEATLHIEEPSDLKLALEPLKFWGVKIDNVNCKSQRSKQRALAGAKGRAMEPWSADYSFTLSK